MNNTAPKQNRTVEIISSVGSWLIPGIIYLNTIAPCVTPGDAGELIVAVHRFSMAHDPGYPLYILLLKLWSFLPIGLGPDPLAFKCNLFSAVAMALACWFFYKVTRTLTGSAAASLAATLVLAFSRTFWKFAVVTEVYALHILLITLILAGLVMAREGKKPVGLVVTAFAFGLGLAHHHTIVLLLPLIFFLWPKGKLEKPVPVAGIIAGLILPLLFYLFLPVLAKNTPQYAETGFTAGNFIDTITRSEYLDRTEWQDLPPEELVEPSDSFRRALDYLPKQFGWILLVLGVAGLFFAPPGKRIWAFWGAITALLYILIIGFFSRGSPIGMPFNFLRSVDEFLIPVNIFISLGVGFLLSPLARLLESRKDFGGTESQNVIPQGLIPVFIMGLLCVIPLFMGISNEAYSNMSHHTFAQDQSRNILVQVPENGVLVVGGDESFIYEYLQEVRAIRDDVEIVVYPFSTVMDETRYNPVDSLAIYLDVLLDGRGCLFTFTAASASVEMLDPPKGLRFDGAALKLVDRLPGQPMIIPGNPDIWTSYQLRNLDQVTLSEIVFDDFEYEYIDRYISGLSAAVNWLDSNGLSNDPSREALVEMADTLNGILSLTDYPTATANN